MTQNRSREFRSFSDQTWAPARFTPPLRPEFLSDGPRLVALLESHMRMPDGTMLRLHDWQRSLLCHVLERFPLDWPDENLRGRLRFRQVVITMGRQNGKSLLGAALAIYGLLQHVAGPSVVGLATSVDQANIVYNRVKYAVENDAAFSRVMTATGTRGITLKSGAGQYVVRPSLREGLQSVPITMAIADELHLMNRVVWDSIVQGQRAQTDAMVCGITTAGNDESELLKHLYEVGDKSMNGQRPRFGFFCWEAPEGATIDDDAAMMAANPSIACGAIDLATARADVIDQPRPDQLRYTLNRFVTDTSAWFPLDVWDELAGTPLPQELEHLTVAVAKVPSWEAACLVAATKLPDGSLVTAPIATLKHPSMDDLEAHCEHLATGGAAVTFVMDSVSLSALGKTLRDRGHDVWILTQNEVCQACSAAFAAVMHRRLHHDGNPIVRAQWARARRRDAGDSWRIDTRAGHDVDAVQAMIYAAWVADRREDEAMQIFA